MRAKREARSAGDERGSKVSGGVPHSSLDSVGKAVRPGVKISCNAMDRISIGVPACSAMLSAPSVSGPKSRRIRLSGRPSTCYFSTTRSAWPPSPSHIRRVAYSFPARADRSKYRYNNPISRPHLLAHPTPLDIILGQINLPLQMRIGNLESSIRAARSFATFALLLGHGDGSRDRGGGVESG